MTFGSPTEPYEAYRQPPKQRKGASTVGWLVAACVFVMLWAFAGAAAQLAGVDPDESDAYRLGVALGHALIASLIIWLVLYFAIVRQQAPKRGLAHYLILLAVGLAASLTALFAVVPMIENRRLLTEIDQSYQTEVTALDDAMINDIRALAGDGSRMLAVTRARDIPTAREDITRAREILVTYEEQLHRVQTDTLERVDTMGGPFAVTARQQFEMGFAEANALRARAVSLNRRGLDNAEAALDVLEGAAGRWERASSTARFMFTNQRDLDAYNSVAIEAEALQREDAVLRAEFDAYLAARDHQVVQTGERP